METAKGKTRDESITRLAERIDNFEKYRHPHARVMAELSVRLARRLGLAQSDVSALAEAALLHDVGLYAMAPPYHGSRGPLSYEERIDMWRHPVIGEQQMAKSNASRHAQLLVRWHHEWWNGSGYPDSLAFEDIPIGARILRAVELYSALISERPYRDALSEKDALVALKSSAGIECDPYVIKALLALLEELREAEPPAEAQTLQAAPAAELSAPALPDATNTADKAAELSPEDQSEPREPWQVGPARERIHPAYVEHEHKAEGEGATATPQAAIGGEGANSVVAAPRVIVPPAPALLPPVTSLLSPMRSKEADESPTWRGWGASRYNRKGLLGFEVSVLRQIDFRSIAIALSGGARLDWYLKSWGRLILSNDPRPWAAAISRAAIEAREPLSEEQINRLMEDLYVPGTRLANPHLRRWFSETDAWWMDNLRRSIESIDDEAVRAQALALGLQTGDYALSFDEDTRDLRWPLTVVFWRLAGRAFGGPNGHPHNRTYNEPVREFVKQARSDLLYLNLPPAHAEQAGSEQRARWREVWVRGTDQEMTQDIFNLAVAPQSKYAYLNIIDRLLRSASHMKTWAIGSQDLGLASARDVSDLIKEHRPVTATYSKDLTEVAGGVRSYIIIAKQP